MGENYVESESEVGTKPPFQVRIKRKNIAFSCDCVKLSDRTVDAVTSSMLKDVHIVTNNDSFNVVIKGKFRRKEICKRRKLQPFKTSNLLEEI